MAGVYKWKKLSDININDNFFDSLKSDYPFFEAWFKRKAKEEKVALTYYESDGLNAFMMLKNNEDEAITLKDKTLMKKNRLKISTLKLSPKVQGNRLGEGAIGIALWNWLESDCEEIYITIFEKQLKLISMLKKMGFIFVGYNLNNECVYLRSKKYIDFSNPYLSFPFICKKKIVFHYCLLKLSGMINYFLILN